VGKGTPEREVAVTYFGVTLAGNFEDHGRPTFKTVLHEARPLAAVAAQLGMNEADAAAALERAKTKMFDARETRVRPFRDEKILTSSNALMIGALAEAGGALGDDAMVARAERALDFVEKALVVRDAAGRARAQRLTKDGLVKGPGFLDDHGYLINAALDVYEVTGDPRRVELARALAEGALDAFHEEGQGWFFTPRDGEALITRSKDPFDGAVPSGFSAMCRALLRLGALVSARYAEIGERALVEIAPAAIANPMAYGQSICELDRLVRGAVDVVLVGPRDDERTRALARTVLARFVPNRTIAWVDPRDASSVEAAAALAEGKPARDVPVAYVCRGRTCSLPVATPEELAALLAASR
jgi:uncharacterized protein YyaL (SSP411 family)